MPSKERQGKWQPFDALSGYQNSLRKVEHEKGKISKPVLLPDALEELNEKLVSAINNNDSVVISYYENGYINEIEGFISKVDTVYKEIVISSIKIKLNSIQDIKVSYMENENL